MTRRSASLKSEDNPEFPVTLNTDGDPVCGATRVRSDTGALRGGPCNRDAGWGTMHPGEGKCREHGGDASTTLDITITDRVRGKSYREVVKHQRLQELIAEEENLGDLDNLDGEIVLIRAMLKLMAESFGLTLTFTEEGLAQTNEGYEKRSEAYISLNSQAKSVIELMNLLSSTLKRKYEILQISNEVIPRPVVRHYITQLTLAAQRTLRNSCSKCKQEHRMRDNLMAAWALIGDI